jgi:hypothetical protein
VETLVTAFFSNDPCVSYGEKVKDQGSGQDPVLFAYKLIGGGNKDPSAKIKCMRLVGWPWESNIMNHVCAHADHRWSKFCFPDP